MRGEDPQVSARDQVRECTEIPRRKALSGRRLPRLPSTTVQSNSVFFFASKQWGCCAAFRPFPVRMHTCRCPCALRSHAAKRQLRSFAAQQAATEGARIRPQQRAFRCSRRLRRLSVSFSRPPCPACASAFSGCADELRGLLAPFAERTPGASEGDALLVRLLINRANRPTEFSRDVPCRLRSSCGFTQCAHFPGCPFLP